MKNRIKIVCVVLAAAVVLLPIANELLWTHSYRYACWRVTHPFGPDAGAFGYVVHKTEPVDIPYLITGLDGPDGWWIESTLEAWFPDAHPPETDRQRYWKQWWQDHDSEHESLVLQYDPPF